MADVFLSRRHVGSVFELLGSKENDITFSLGWALGRSDALMAALASHLGAPAKQFDKILLQQHVANGGYTDVELVAENAHIILEAKRGWWLPGPEQFLKYLPRFEEERKPWRMFVGASDCTSSYATSRLAAEHGGVPTKYLGWREFAALARSADGSHAEKRLHTELIRYLSTVATMQNPESNMVFVVPLAHGEVRAGLRWIDIVTKHGRYFHPEGTKTWPKEPPNYIGFRYSGRLQSIHRIEAWEVTTDVLSPLGFPSENWDRPHYLYTLGPAIRPAQEVKSHDVFGPGHNWAMIDLLLTSASVGEAVKQTKHRRGEG